MQNLRRVTEFYLVCVFPYISGSEAYFQSRAYMEAISKQTLTFLFLNFMSCPVQASFNYFSFMDLGSGLRIVQILDSGLESNRQLNFESVKQFKDIK